MGALSTYSVAIRTLGKAGEKFERMIRSLELQTIPPERILVYIAEGYPIPQKVGCEEYVSVPKGMVHQRALPYEEVESEYLLLCDDDMLFEQDSVERLFEGLRRCGGDAISPNVYFNHRWDMKEKLIQSVFHGLYPSLFTRYAFRVRRSGYFSYRLHPREVMETQCFAGGCILLKKTDFLSISLQDENWMDINGYPLGEDLVFAYKLHCSGFKVLVHSGSGISHQDAGSSHETDRDADYEKSLFMRYAIWYRCLYSPAGLLGKPLCLTAFYGRWLFRYAVSLASWALGRNKISHRSSIRAIRDARIFTRSELFVNLPPWPTKK